MGGRRTISRLRVISGLRVTSRLRVSSRLRVICGLRAICDRWVELWWPDPTRRALQRLQRCSTYSGGPTRRGERYSGFTVFAVTVVGLPDEASAKLAGAAGSSSVLPMRDVTSPIIAVKSDMAKKVPKPKQAR